MTHWILKAYALAQVAKSSFEEEHGQDLVEYAAVISLVVLALIGGMGTLANGINTAMTSVSGKIQNSLS